MAHFYGTLEGNRGQATRMGTKASGLSTIAASWEGAVSVEIQHHEETGKDTFTISLIPWHGNGINRTIATGNLDGSVVNLSQKGK